MTARRALLLLMAAAAALVLVVAERRSEATTFAPGVAGIRLPQGAGAGAAWSPDGRWIAIPSRTGILLRNVESGARKQIHAPPPRGEMGFPVSLNWSPTGGALRYVTSRGPTRRRDFWVTAVRRDGSSLRRAPLGVRVQQTTWAPKGWPLAFSTGPYAYDVEEGPLGPPPALWTLSRLTGKPKRILAPLQGDVRSPAFSPDGKRILFTLDQRGVEMWTVNADGSAPRRLTARLRGGFAAWAPDGKSIALAVTTQHGDLRQHLYAIAAKGGRLHRLSPEETAGAPAWSPDGRWIAYANFNSEIRMVHPNGSGEVVVARLPGEEVGTLIWSPDGRHLAYTAWPIRPSD